MPNVRQRNVIPFEKRFSSLHLAPYNSCSELDMRWMDGRISHIDIRKCGSLLPWLKLSHISISGFLYISRLNFLSHQNRSHGTVEELPSLPCTSQHYSDAHSLTCLIQNISCWEACAFISSACTEEYVAQVLKNISLVTEDNYWNWLSDLWDI